MGTSYEPVNLMNIKRGAFIAEAATEFDELQTKLIAYVEEHEQSASADLVLKISLKYDAKAKHYAIVSDVVSKPPKEPPQVTTAFLSDQGGKECLFCPAGGTTSHDARQAELQDAEGVPITK